MDTADLPGPEPIDGVLFDLHSTLVDQGAASDWVAFAWQHAGREGDPARQLGDASYARLVDWADRVWEHAREIDPDSRRDLDPGAHREVFEALVARAPEVDPALTSALYATLLEAWFPYQDALPVLRALHDRGVRTALVSNIGIDVTTLLARSGMRDLLDAVVLSYDVGVVKPQTEIFAEALQRIEVPAHRALMVGDSWRDDAGAVDLGVRTLLLPRSRGPAHGLELVLRLVAG